ncbi:N-acetylmuramoyl-L-alanine amidase family protein [Ammoniphilus resinae]|uniref:N-acetylmuramoyl-L-alanine amidase n=1 Tax=Ammoniphilus resinae TaxID=861532 RepID=A0ABS4GJZ8_9BACL|nr:N-acetylmuramoyl-L-alanine amidase family protein [Ammoniphilus resinae]MBP1930588.1 N-acetylmuramoyl-L-alanine amidase [Ammoniphilus resinae]
MKRFCLWLGALMTALLLLPLAQVYADQPSPSPIQLVVEGKSIQTDVAPTLVENRTFVPIRVVATNLNATVQWIEKEKKIEITDSANHITMVVGDKMALVNSQEVQMDVPPIVKEGRTLVPLRFVGESLGTNVGWEPNTKTVLINKFYSLMIDGNTVDREKYKVFKIQEELYLPYYPLESYFGSGKQEPSGETITNLKLRKLDTGWIIPLSIFKEHYRVPVEMEDQGIYIGTTEDEEETENDGNSDENTIEESSSNQLRGIDIEDEEIILETSNLDDTPKHFSMTSPNRLVIDLPNISLSNRLDEKVDPAVGMGKLDVALDQDLINEIRYSQFSRDPETVRVVIEFSRKVNYTIQPNKKGWAVNLNALPKKEGFLIVLDAGHGGSDPGAAGAIGNHEKDFTLAVTRLLKEQLEQMKGIQIVETRSGDTYPTLQDRVQLAEDVAADLFLSIHANSFKPETRGTETYYYTEQSKDFASILHKYLIEATNFPDRGVKKQNFYVIKNTTMPSSLLEIGFLTNKEENQRMLDPGFQQNLAEKLSQAIYEYYTINN